MQYTCMYTCANPRWSRSFVRNVTTHKLMLVMLSWLFMTQIALWPLPLPSPINSMGDKKMYRMSRCAVASEISKGANNNARRLFVLIANAYIGFGGRKYIRGRSLQ